MYKPFQQERRKASRVALMKRSAYMWEGKLRECMTLNISKVGIAFASNIKHNVGDVLHLQVVLDILVNIKISVVRMEETAGARYRYLYGASIESAPSNAIENYIQKVIQETENLCKE